MASEQVRTIDIAVKRGEAPGRVPHLSEMPWTSQGLSNLSHVRRQVEGKAGNFAQAKNEKNIYLFFRADVSVGPQRCPWTSCVNLPLDGVTLQSISRRRSLGELLLLVWWWSNADEPYKPLCRYPS